MAKMLKKADFYSALTTKNEPVWQGDWKKTLEDIQFAGIKAFNDFL